MIQISEVQKKHALLAQRMAGEQGLPLSVAMVLAGVDQMLQLRQRPDTVRALVERAITMHAGVVMPSRDELARVLGPLHDDRADSKG